MSHHNAFAVPVQALDIMVVDDSESMRRLYRTCLSAFDISSPRMFESSRDALIEIESSPPDLVIVDWRMGPPNGLDFLRLLRSSVTGAGGLVAAIMVTGHASESFVKQAMRAGVQQFLVKPVSPRILYERINWVTNDSRELAQNGDRLIVEGVEERLKWHERSVGEALRVDCDVPQEPQDDRDFFEL